MPSKASKPRKSSKQSYSSKPSKYSKPSKSNSKAKQASNVADFANTADYDFPSILVVREEGRKGGRIQKVSFKPLKIEYDIVKYLYFGKFSLEL